MLKTIKFKVLMTDGSRELPRMTDSMFTPEKACEFLEQGAILFFPETPFKFSQADRQFLLSQKQKDADYHKNIAYRPLENRITGVSPGTDVEHLRSIMGDYYSQTFSFLQNFLAPYAKHWQPDFGSFRPLEEQGRKMRLRARNDLLHVDSFPTRPIYGNRILRTFVNLNPKENRVWQTSDTFEVLARTFKDSVARPGDLNKTGSQSSALQSLAKMLGFKSNSSSAYDRWMLDFHNFLKENTEFQTSCRKDRWEFPPNSSWMVFTDMVSHSVLSGQYALEQTFIVSYKDQMRPEKAPINILRDLYNQ